MKKWHLTLTVLLISLTLSFINSAISYAQPKISNCDISPKKIAYKTEVTISFDYENVEGGLKEGQVTLTQRFRLPQQEEVVRTSNWQPELADLSAYTAESGRFEKRFINPDIWRGPIIELTYEIKVIDKNGKESNACTTTIMPK